MDNGFRRSETQNILPNQSISRVGGKEGRRERERGGRKGERETGPDANLLKHIANSVQADQLHFYRMHLFGMHGNTLCVKRRSALKAVIARGPK